MGTVVPRPGKVQEPLPRRSWTLSPNLKTASKCQTTLKYGRPWPCKTTSTKSKNWRIRLMVAPTSDACPASKSTAQPTREGFEKAIEKACGDKWPKDGPILWINMRQEPIVYVNGSPLCARPPNKIGEYAELGDVTAESINKDEDEFGRMLKKRAEDGGKIKVVSVSKVDA